MSSSTTSRIHLLGGAAFALSFVCAPSVASAQSIDQAVQAYNEDRLEEAAFFFADIVERSSSADDRVQAEYYLAHSLFRAGYVLPGFAFYRSVFVQGPSHPYFLKATEGLLSVVEATGDDILVPNLLSEFYAAEFQNLSPERLNSINYLVAVAVLRKRNLQEAADFLGAVAPGSKEYPRAQYLLAFIALLLDQDPMPNYDAIETRLADTLDEDEKKLFRLALLGKARTFYAQGKYTSSVEYYEKVPRFSDDWYDAMFESGWAYRQNALDQTTREGFSREVGKALGMTHSIQSPYFDGRFRAESFVLKATAYFDMCHFDRARKALDTLFALYEPVAEALKPWRAGEQTDSEMLKAIVDGNADLPEEIRLRVSTNRRFKKYAALAEKGASELESAREKFPQGGLRNQLLELISDLTEQAIGLAGQVARAQVEREAAQLDGFLSQASIVKFETADAERKMLEAGRDITKGPRARGPTPFVPSGKSQFWSFNGEYWIDELGYYQHSIKNECFAEAAE